MTRDVTVVWVEGGGGLGLWQLCYLLIGLIWRGRQQCFVAGLIVGVMLALGYFQILSVHHGWQLWE